MAGLAAPGGARRPDHQPVDPAPGARRGLPARRGLRGGRGPDGPPRDAARAGPRAAPPAPPAGSAPGAPGPRGARLVPGGVPGGAGRAGAGADPGVLRRRGGRAHRRPAGPGRAPGLRARGVAGPRLPHPREARRLPAALPGPARRADRGSTVTPSTEDDRNLVAYLLGALPPEEEAGLEERYLCDQELFDRLRAVEAELIDDYWRGALTPEARGRFESHYLATPPQRERAALGQALVSRVAGLRARPATHRLRWATAAAVLGMAVSAWLLVRPPAPVVPSPASSSAAPPATPVAGPVPPAPPAWRHLTPGRVRTLDGTAELRRGEADLALALGSARASSPYRLALQTAEGRTIWRQADLRATDTERGRALLVRLPPTMLAPGDYVLVVEGARAEDAAEYFF